MASLTLRTGHACESVRHWNTTVASADGKRTYTVTWTKATDPWERGREYDWRCSCPDYERRKAKNRGEYCKHIQAVLKAGDPRCCWIDLFDPSTEVMFGARHTCPECGDTVFDITVFDIETVSPSEPKSVAG